MPFFVISLWNGQRHHAIDHGDGKKRRVDERLGTELARIEITEEQAKLGINEILRQAHKKPDEAYYGA